MKSLSLGQRRTADPSPVQYLKCTGGLWQWPLPTIWWVEIEFECSLVSSFGGRTDPEDTILVW